MFNEVECQSLMIIPFGVGMKEKRITFLRTELEIGIEIDRES